MRSTSDLSVLGVFPFTSHPTPFPYYPRLLLIEVTRKYYIVHDDSHGVSVSDLVILLGYSVHCNDKGKIFIPLTLYTLTLTVIVHDDSYGVSISDLVILLGYSVHCNHRGKIFIPSTLYTPIYLTGSCLSTFPNLKFKFRFVKQRSQVIESMVFNICDSNINFLTIS